VDGSVVLCFQSVTQVNVHQYVVRDVSLRQCAGFGFLIRENNITAALIDHLCHECGDKNLVPAA
jgi:hypothetical protein